VRARVLTAIAIQTTRVLAEEQFMKRALVERIQASLPMGASVRPGWT
jgi:ESCRT-I complex subunit TSG101